METRPPTRRSTRKGFLLNHVIDDLLPPRGDGYRYANADPVTGQAAWFDLRVRLVRDAQPHVAEHRIEYVGDAAGNAA